MGDKMQNYLITALAFIAFILCFIFLANEPLSEGDCDASAAYVCFASIVSFMISLRISYFPILKKVVIALAVLTFIVLIYVYIESLGVLIDLEGNKSINWSDFAGYESGNILVMIPAMILIYFGFYKYICKKEKQELEEQNN